MGKPRHVVRVYRPEDFDPKEAPAAIYTPPESGPLPEPLRKAGLLFLAMLCPFAILGILHILGWLWSMKLWWMQTLTMGLAILAGWTMLRITWRGLRGRGSESGNHS